MRLENTPVLETGRLLLRPFRPEDRVAILNIFGDWEANVYLPWFPLQTLEEAERFFEERYSRLYRQPRGYGYAVCLKGDGVPIGYVNVSLAEGYDLGYGLRHEFWHRGITTEAARAVVERVKADGLPYLTATHDVNNPRSGSVMRRLGMKYCYSYQEQWQPKDCLVTFRLYQLNFDGGDAVYWNYWKHSNVHFIEEMLSANPGENVPDILRNRAACGRIIREKTRSGANAAFDRFW